MTFLELVQVNVTLKRVARTHGGEWAGPCPFCGGRDRFRVWPNHKEGTGGRFWCRGCGKAGDAIDYLRESRGLSFAEACAELEIDPKQHRVRQTEKEGFELREATSPSLKWQARAGAFLKGTVETLWKSKEALSFLYGRGLRDETIQAAGLGWNPRTRYEEREAWGLEPLRDEKGGLKKLWLPAGLVIPWTVGGDVLRLRIRRPAGETRYYNLPASDMRPMIFHRGQDGLTVVESELDALLIEQEAGDLIGVVALGTATAKPDQELNGLLKRASSILVSLDFDEAGARAAWRYWLSTYRNARRWPTPTGKDPSEAFQQGVNIRAWIKAGITIEPSSLQREKATEAEVKPFPKEWLQKYDEGQLERLAIMTIDGRLSDREALRLLN